MLNLSIDEIAANPSRAIQLPRSQRQSIVQRCAAVIAIVSSSENDQIAPKTRILNAEEAAVMMNMPIAWMKRNGRKLPGAIKTGRTWGWFEETLAKHVRTRAGR
jgi:hypothetical protein